MRLDQTSRLAATWYLGVAVTCTVVAGSLHWLLAPPTGLVRTVYSDVGFAGEPLVQDRTSEVSLAFLEEDASLPRRFFSVQWRGFWFLPRAQSVDLYAGADDRVDVLVDGALVLRRNPSVGMHTISETITLGAGAHEIIVRYEQDGGATRLYVQRAFETESPRAFVPARLFPERPSLQDARLATGTYWLTRLVAILWLVPIAGLFLMTAEWAWHPTVRYWRTVAPRTVGDYWRRLQLVAFPALLGPAVVLLFGPHTIFKANRSEFSAAFADITWPWLLIAVGGAWTILLGVGCVISLLSIRVVRLYASLLFAGGVLLWAQGNILVADYGLLYGESLDFGPHQWRTAYDAALWIGGVILAVVFAKQVCTVAPLASQLLIGLQALVLVVPGFLSTTDTQSTAPESEFAPEEIYQLSRGQNVIHVVLDGFRSDVFGEVLAQDRVTFDRDLSGFFFFADHLGAFPTTRASMPAMLTGIAYRNDTPMSEFVRETNDERSLFRVLARRGYAIHSVSFVGGDHPNRALLDGRDPVRFSVHTPYGSFRDYVDFAAAQLIDVSLFRHVPQGLKKRVYNEQAWLLQSWYSESRQSRNATASNHAAFFRDFTQRLTVAVDEPVYTLLHLAIPHPGIVMDARCSFIGPTRLDSESFAAQSRCGLALAQDLLDRLRVLGVYDSSLVLLTSDHGWRVGGGGPAFRGISTPAGNLGGIVQSAMALLAVKPPGSGGPVQTSYAPTAITDIPATIYDLLGLPIFFPGDQSAFQIDPDIGRRREYAHHSWVHADWARPYLDVLHLFSVDGEVGMPSSWSFQRAISAPTDDR